MCEQPCQDRLSGRSLLAVSGALAAAGTRWTSASSRLPGCSWGHTGSGAGITPVQAGVNNEFSERARHQVRLAHEVLGSARPASALGERGIEPLMGDFGDPVSLASALRESRPDIVVSTTR